MRYTIDGRWALEEQRRAIQFKENLAFLEMVELKAGGEEALSDDQGSTFPLNVVTFRDWEGSSPCPELHLEVIPSRQDLVSVIATNTAQGRKLTCAEDAFVGGEKAIVGCFR